MAYDLLLERFLRYAKINTRSDENATRTPTTQSQVDFALNILKPELEELGLSNIHYLESNGYLVATLPANDDRLTRKIGFISHMDTADFNAEGVSPQVIESYDGGIIPLGTSGYNLDPADFPNLQNYIGQTLITTDGTTLLGADDKSGIAEIMTALAHLKAKIADEMNKTYGQTRVDLVIKDQYYNMRQVIEKDMMPVELAKEVMEDLGIVPVIEPIRGGTDGSKISFKGIPTPNIFAGGENMHGRYEFVSLQTMEKAVDVILGIISKP